MTKPLTIAELGSNSHPFTKDRINMFIEYAALAGADAVKIQLFKAEHFPNAERAAKQNLEFPRELFGWFLDRARFYRLQGGASVFDEEAIDLCVRLGSNFVKLATREQSNLALREAVNREFKGTIYRSVDFDALDEYEPRLPREVTLGCITRYPTAMTSKLIHEMSRRLPAGHLGSPWGWSSHSVLFDDVIHATSMGARVIEKHLRLFQSDIEARWSINPGQWSVMERLLKYV